MIRSRAFAAVAAGLIITGCGAGHHPAHRPTARTAPTSTSTATKTATPATKPATPSTTTAAITGSPPPARRVPAVAYLTAGRGRTGVVLNGRRVSLGGGDRATAALVAPSGQLVAIAAAGPTGVTLRVDRRDGSVYLTMPASAAALVPLAWSPDNRYLAVGLRGGAGGSRLEVVDTRTGALTLNEAGRTDRASFAPARPDTVFFDLDRSRIAGHPSPDLWSATANPGGGLGDAGPITHDGRSTAPLRTRAGIVYDAVEDLPGFARPVYQLAIWGRKTIHPAQTPDAAARAGGLVAIAASATGRELVAAPRRGGGVYVVDSVTRKVRTVSTASGIAPVGISRDGRQLLVTLTRGTARSSIAAIPLGGGPPRVIARGATQPSWNR